MFIFDGVGDDTFLLVAQKSSTITCASTSNPSKNALSMCTTSAIFNAFLSSDLNASFKSSISMFFMRSFALNTFACRSTFFFNMSDNCSQFCSDFFNLSCSSRNRSSVTSLDARKASSCRLACSDSCWYLEMSPKALFSFVCFSCNLECKLALSSSKNISFEDMFSFSLVDCERKRSISSTRAFNTVCVFSKDVLNDCASDDANSHFFSAFAKFVCNRSISSLLVSIVLWCSQIVFSANSAASWKSSR